MKKALSITLAGTLFTIEEDAYAKLNEYLQSVQAYFGTYPDSAEILKDIEARMAEQLLAMHGNASAVVTIDNVTKLIAIMGRVEDFENTEGSGAGSDASNKGSEQSDFRANRRLMRDPDDVVIAGVASGMAHYFNTDVTVMRLIFIVLSIIMGGAGGIIIYLILAVILPAAKTPAEKVMMRGGPVSLESFKQNVSDMAANIKEKGERIFHENAKPRNFLDKLFRLIGKIVITIVRIVVKLAGIIVTVASAVGIAALVFGLIVVIFNGKSLGDIALVYDMVPALTYYLWAITIFIAGVIPLIFISMGGRFLLKWDRPRIRQDAVIGLIVIWIVAAAIATSIGTRYVPIIQERVDSSPEYQQTTRTIEVSDFTKLDLREMATVHLVQGTTTSVVVKGRIADLDRTRFTVTSQTLSYRQSSINGFCLFCKHNEMVDITISTPKLEAITAQGYVRIDGDEFVTDHLDIEIKDISHLALPIKARSVNVNGNDVSRITLTGTATTLDVEMTDVARFDGSDLEAKDVTVETTDVSRAEVFATSSLSITARDASHVRYDGGAKADVKESDVATVEME